MEIRFPERPRLLGSDFRHFFSRRGLVVGASVEKVGNGPIGFEEVMVVKDGRKEVAEFSSVAFSPAFESDFDVGEKSSCQSQIAQGSALQF